MQSNKCEKRIVPVTTGGFWASHTRDAKNHMSIPVAFALRGRKCKLSCEFLEKDSNPRQAGGDTALSH